MNDVRVGQVWRDCDKRMNGRTIVIERVQGDYAYAKVVGSSRPTRIALRRMYRHSTGWELIKDAQWTT